MIQQMRASGRSVSADDIRYLEQQYGLNRPFLLRYGKWFLPVGAPAGDFWRVATAVYTRATWASR